jgi:hypothetical protein
LTAISPKFSVFKQSCGDATNTVILLFIFWEIIYPLITSTELVDVQKQNEENKETELIRDT